MSKLQCVGLVWLRYRYVQCTRKGSVERDGEPYCKQHDPVAREERSAARLVAWKAKRNAEKEKIKTEMIAVKFHKRLVDALRELDAASDLLAEIEKEQVR